jgi:hypothetical protein
LGGNRPGGKDQGQSKERSGTHGVIVFDRARKNP